MTRINAQTPRPTARPAAAAQSKPSAAGSSAAATQATGWKPGAGQAKKFKDAFHRSPYTNADAGVVQKKMGFKSIDQAKEFIGKAITQGREATLDKMGVTRHLFDRQDCLTAFKRSGYSTADAKEAMRVFDFLKGGTLENAKEYLGLKIRNKYEKMLTDVGITRIDYDDHEMIPLAKRKGYTEADAKQAIARFDFLAGASVREAMGYLGLKVANDYEEMLREVGIKPSGRAAAD